MADLTLQAGLEIEVDDRSLSSARSEIEDAVSGVEISPSSGGGSGGSSGRLSSNHPLKRMSKRASKERAMQRQLDTKRNDLLDELIETIEKGLVDGGFGGSSGGGGGGNGGFLGGFLGGTGITSALKGGAGKIGGALGKAGTMARGVMKKAPKMPSTPGIGPPGIVGPPLVPKIIKDGLEGLENVGIGEGFPELKGGSSGGGTAGMASGSLAMMSAIPEDSPLRTGGISFEGELPSLDAPEWLKNIEITVPESLKNFTLSNPLQGWDWPTLPTLNLDAPSWLESALSTDPSTLGGPDSVNISLDVPELNIDQAALENAIENAIPIDEIVRRVQRELDNRLSRIDLNR